MNARLQRRIQRYGWDLAARDYDLLWQEQLAIAHGRAMQLVELRHGERVLDVACGTGRISVQAADAVGADGTVSGVDISAHMIDTARRRAVQQKRRNVDYLRMDAEALAFPDGSFDAAVCAFGLMYVPDPLRALREMRRVLRSGGRLAIAVWGERSRCGWSGVFPIIDDEVSSEVCPLFFNLGHNDNLLDLCADAGFDHLQLHRIDTVLRYQGAGDACDAVLVGGPVALAWSKFDAQVRSRVRSRYLASIESWRDSHGYAIPAQFVIVSAAAP